MSLSAGFSGKQFWGIQLSTSLGFKSELVSVEPSTKLHISKALVLFNGYEPHEASCRVGVYVQYQNVDTSPDPFGLHMPSKKCAVCALKSENGYEAVLDLDFASGKTVSFSIQEHCYCGSRDRTSVSLSGYMVGC